MLPVLSFLHELWNPSCDMHDVVEKLYKQCSQYAYNAIYCIVQCMYFSVPPECRPGWFAVVYVDNANQKPANTYIGLDNCTCCFDNVQHYGNYLKCHNDVNIMCCQPDCHHIAPLVGIITNAKQAYQSRYLYSEYMLC